MYTCGPTVYDYAHIGNFRTFIFLGHPAPLAARSAAYKLDHVMNITDVEDKIIRNAAAAAQDRSTNTPRSTPQAFLEDCATLRLEAPRAHRPAPPNTSTKWPHAIEQARRRRLHLSQRRLGLFPHRDLSRLRQAFAQRFQRHARRRARRRGRIRKGRRPRFRALESAQRRRALLGHGDRPGPPRLAHRVLRDGDEVSGRDARHPRRRRRSDLSASRKRDRAIGSAHRQAVRRASGCTPSF